jgi:hypothetical protein
MVFVDRMGSYDAVPLRVTEKDAALAVADW